MNLIKNIMFSLCVVLIGVSASVSNSRAIGGENLDVTSKNAPVHENVCYSQKIPSQDSMIASNVYATGYYCVYESEMDGFQTVSINISNSSYNLKASFLFGGYGVAMQGTGRTGPNGEYIKYSGAGGCFVRISGSNAGENLSGRRVENPKTLRERYAQLGITDFAGFGNLALSHPEKAAFSCSSQIYGSTGVALEPWRSIAVDPSLINNNQSFTLIFKDGSTTPFGTTSANFKAEDIGGNIKGMHIDIYLGEGQAAWNEWLKTGGNRYVDIYASE